MNSEILERHRLALAVYVAWETGTSQDCAEMLRALEEKCDDVLQVVASLIAVPHMILTSADSIEEGLEHARFLMGSMALLEAEKEST